MRGGVRMIWQLSTPPRAVKITKRVAARVFYAEYGRPDRLLTRYGVASMAGVEPLRVNTLDINAIRAGRATFMVGNRIFYRAAERIPARILDPEARRAKTPYRYWNRKEVAA